MYVLSTQSCVSFVDDLDINFCETGYKILYIYVFSLSVYQTKT